MRRLNIGITILLVGWFVPFVRAAQTITNGAWKGYAPGEYRIEKETVRNAKYMTNGTFYLKKVLRNADKDGTGSLVSFKADELQGPWKAQLGWGSEEGPSYRRDATVTTNVTSNELLKIGGKSFRCDLVKIKARDDWGTTTYQRWIDNSTGLKLKEDELFEGQDSKGKRANRKTLRKTTGFEQVMVMGKPIECFVQEIEQTTQKGEHWRWQELVSAEVPGQCVRRKLWTEQGAPPEMEWELVEFGLQPESIAEYERDSQRQGVFTDEQYDKRRRDEEAQEARKVEELAQRVIKELASGSVHQRTSAAGSLANWDFADADKTQVIEALRRALDDESREVRRYAAWGLSRHGVKGLTDRFSELMKEDPKGTSDYLRAIGAQRDDGALKVVLGYIDSTNRMVRTAAAMALGNFHTDSARLALERLAADKQSGVAFQALQSLEKVGDERSARVVLSVLESGDRHLGSTAVRLAAKWNIEAAVPALLKALRQGDESSRFAVATYLAQMKLQDDTAVRRALVEALDDPALKVRVAAAGTLGEMRERSAVPKLIELAKSSEHKEGWFDSRVPFGIAVAKIGGKEALTVVPKLLTELGMRPAVVDSLNKPDAEMAEVVWQDYLDAPAHDKLGAAQCDLQAIGRIGTKKMVGKLKRYLEKCPPPEKRCVREVIEEIEKRQG